MNDKTPSTSPYKGVRDFYPEDQFVQRYLYAIMRETVEQYGYEEYDASLLEPAELYEAKSSDEIVRDQTYTFTDRGERRVTLRPEMTPTVARMIARERKTMRLPVRWYSIANLFRYERPQRGRLREHVQLNADLFGVSNIEADTEIIELAARLLVNAGATSEDFTISVSSRDILNDIYNLYAIDTDTQPALTRILDKKHKLSPEKFREQVAEHAGERTDDLLTTLDSPDQTIAMLGNEHPAIRELIALLDALKKRGITNAVFDPTLVRGFDYYTGMVFEVYDTDPENNRSMFGGGRYDNLLSTFSAEPTPAVGFGMGDVTLQDFLERRDLIPAYRSSADVALCITDANQQDHAQDLADRLRHEHGLYVRLDITNRKIGDQIKDADRSAIPFVICIGTTEAENETYTIKHLASGNDKTGALDELPNAMDELAETDEGSHEWHQ